MQQSTAYQQLIKELNAGATIVIDGAVGTELQRRGASVRGRAWCALASETAPDTLLAIHRDYLHAGARVIVANTFASTREVLEPLQLGDKFTMLNQRSVEIALSARETTNAQALVAGSISHTRPARVNVWSPSYRDPAQFEQDCHEMACLHKSAGCDLIIAEMLGDIRYSPPLIRAAHAAGLPVWLGFSALRRGDGVLRTYTSDSTPFADAVEAIFAAIGDENIREDIDVAGIMHTTADDTAEALAILAKHWRGITLAYPDSMPLRKTEEEANDLSQSLSPGELVAHCRQWVDGGVQLIGGCCGLSVPHIAALTKAFGKDERQ